MNKPTVIVTGGSYMTPSNPKDLYYADTHFSEIVAKELNADLVVLSNGGCSNFSIALQVEKAINWHPRPVLILTGTVPFDRMELPLQSEIPHISIDDQIYHIKNFKSYNRNKKSKFISTAIRDFFDDTHLNLWKEEGVDIEKFIGPVKSYFENLYNQNIKRKQDELIIYSYYHKLHESGIPYFICQEDYINIEECCPWLLESKNCHFHIGKEVAILIQNDSSSQSGSPYHTSRKCQKEIADVILKSYEKNFNSRR